MEQLTIGLEMDREEKRRDQSPKVCEIKNVFNPAIQNEKTKCLFFLGTKLFFSPCLDRRHKISERNMIDWRNKIKD